MRNIISDLKPFCANKEEHEDFSTPFFFANLAVATNTSIMAFANVVPNDEFPYRDYPKGRNTIQHTLEQLDLIYRNDQFEKVDFYIEKPEECGACLGKGYVYWHPCSVCHGLGYLEVEIEGNEEIKDCPLCGGKQGVYLASKFNKYSDARRCEECAGSGFEFPEVETRILERTVYTGNLYLIQDAPNIRLATSESDPMVYFYSDTIKGAMYGMKNDTTEQ